MRSIFNLKKSNIIAPNKKDNKKYQFWLTNSSIETKTLLENMSGHEVNKFFKKNIRFSPNGLISKLGIGSERINQFTINHISKALLIFLKQQNLSKILLTTNNNKNKAIIDLFVKILKFNDIEVYTFEEFVQTQGLLSFVLDKQIDKAGLYIDIDLKNIEIKFFMPTGIEFSALNYSQLNFNMRNILFEFPIFSFNEKIKTKIIGSNFIDSYYNKLISEEDDFFSIYKTIIVVHSDAVEKNILRIKKSTSSNFQIIRSFEKKIVKDISSPTAFSAGYKLARKEKANLIFSFDSSGSKLGIAIKSGSSFKFLSSLEIGALLVAIKGRNTKITSTELGPKFLKKFSKENSDNQVTIGTNYKHSINGISWFDANINFLFIFKKCFNKPEILFEFLDKVEKTVGFFYDKTTVKEITEKQIKSFLNNLNFYKKMDEINIKSLKIERNDEYEILARVNLTNGEVIFLFEKINSTLTTYYYYVENDYTVAHLKSNELVKVVESFVENKGLNYELESKKGIRKVTIFSILTLLIIVLIFTFLFDWNQIIYSFSIIFTSWNSGFLYLLFSNFILFAIPSSLIFYFSIKRYKKDTKFRDVWKGFIIYTFFLCISPLKLFSVGALVWYLSKKKYKSSELVPAVAFNLFIGILMNFLVSVPLMIYGIYFSSNLGVDVLFLTILSFTGLFVWSGGVVLIVFIAYSKTLQNILFSLAERIFFRFGIEKYYSSFYREIVFNIHNTRKNNQEIISNKPLIAISAIIMVIGKFYSQSMLFSSINIVAESEGITTLGQYFWGLISVNVLTQNAALIIPTPSGVGFSELFLSVVLKNLTGDPALALNGTFIYRFFTYYAIAFITLVPFVWKMKSVLVENHRKGKENIWTL